MPSLVVIRSGSKHVDYLENRNGEKPLCQTEDYWRGLRSKVAVSKSFRNSQNLYDADVINAFRCAGCGNVVANRDDVISKMFFGRTGKAFLMNHMYNVSIGPAHKRDLMTGLHTIADIMCCQCDFGLGWKYLKAMETSQKYKEGKFIIEHALIEDDLEEHTWNRL
ncbi:hypothetical protein CCR75_009512 [Bremia lactucae]|uniref:Protein yippee-like n=1 Tax=Bremia lactucae TaxID=4779 RepID=A0A976II37_BRELC|nr:hypothetical protein CCR75_009512 [Bremia lactucae]